MIYLKRAGCVLLFLLGLLVILIVASAIFKPKNNIPSAGMEETLANGILGEPENTIDVLIIGDSESRCAICPMQIWKETGFTTYVCATAAQKLSYSYTMLDRAFQRQKPKIVILETLAIFREMSLADAVEETLYHRLPVLRYHDRWKCLHVNDFGGAVLPVWTNDSKGYWNTKKVDPGSNEPYMGAMDAKSSVSLLNRRYVLAIKTLCEKNGARLLLLSTPSTINWNYALHNGIQAVADELGIEYIDMNLMNDRIKIDWSRDTFDKGDHLNHSGAVKLSLVLSEYLQEQGIFKDHRGDQVYAKWEDILKDRGTEPEEE